MCIGGWRSWAITAWVILWLGPDSCTWLKVLAEWGRSHRCRGTAKALPLWTPQVRNSADQMLVSQQRIHLPLFCLSSCWMTQVSPLFTVFLRNAPCPAITFCSSLKIHSRNSRQAKGPSRRLHRLPPSSAPSHCQSSPTRSASPWPAFCNHPSSLSSWGRERSIRRLSFFLKPSGSSDHIVCSHPRAPALTASSTRKLLPQVFA